MDLPCSSPASGYSSGAGRGGVSLQELRRNQGLTPSETGDPGSRAEGAPCGPRRAFAEMGVEPSPCPWVARRASLGRLAVFVVGSCHANPAAARAGTGVAEPGGSSPAWPPSRTFSSYLKQARSWRPVVWLCALQILGVFPIAGVWLASWDPWETHCQEGLSFPPWGTHCLLVPWEHWAGRLQVPATPAASAQSPLVPPALSPSRGLEQPVGACDLGLGVLEPAWTSWQESVMTSFANSVL